jgi:hypothetical protein
MLYTPCGPPSKLADGQTGGLVPVMALTERAWPHPDGRLWRVTHESLYLRVPDYEPAPPYSLLPLKPTLLRLTRTGIRKFQRQASDLAGPVEDHFPDCPAARESQRDIHQGVTTELPGGRGIYALQAAGGIHHRRPPAGKVDLAAQARVELHIHLLPAAPDQVAE